MYKTYFKEFYISQPKAVRDKINYSLYMVETLKIIPSKFFRNIEGSEGLYEIRTEYGGNIYRVFCCMKTDAIVAFFQGFQKKTQKTPAKEIKMAERLRKEYFKDKKE